MWGRSFGGVFYGVVLVEVLPSSPATNRAVTSSLLLLLLLLLYTTELPKIYLVLSEKK
jgi:hypothetical protein